VGPDNVDIWPLLSRARSVNLAGSLVAVALSLPVLVANLIRLGQDPFESLLNLSTLLSLFGVAVLGWFLAPKVVASRRSSWILAPAVAVIVLIVESLWLGFLGAFTQAMGAQNLVDLASAIPQAIAYAFVTIGLFAWATYPIAVVVSLAWIWATRWVARILA
jgi:hypothetical protein